MNNLFTADIMAEAFASSSFDRATGTDGFYGATLKGDNKANLQTHYNVWAIQILNRTK